MDCLLEARNHATERACVLRFAEEYLQASPAVLKDAVRAGHQRSATAALELVSRLRQEGVVATLARLVPVADAIVYAVTRFIEGWSWLSAWRTLSSDEEILLDSAADIWIENMLVAARVDGRSSTILEARRELLRIARQDGLDGARRWLLAQEMPYTEQPGRERWDALCVTVFLTRPSVEPTFPGPVWSGFVSQIVSESREGPQAAERIDAAIRLLSFEILPEVEGAFPDAEAAVRLGVGRLYLHRINDDHSHNRALGLAWLEDTLRLVELGHAPALRGTVHEQLGNAYARSQIEFRGGDLQHAVEQFGAASTAYEASGDHEGRARVRTLLAHVSLEMVSITDDPEDRRELLREAIRLLSVATPEGTSQYQTRQLSALLARAYAANAEFVSTDASLATKIMADLLAETPIDEQADQTAWIQSVAATVGLARWRIDPEFDLGPSILAAEAAVATPRGSQGLAAGVFELLGDLQLAVRAWEPARGAYLSASGAGIAYLAEQFTPIGFDAAVTGNSAIDTKMAYAMCRLEDIEGAISVADRSKGRTIREAQTWNDAITSLGPREDAARLAQAIQQVRAQESSARLPPQLRGQVRDLGLSVAVYDARQALAMVADELGVTDRLQPSPGRAMDVVEGIPHGAAMVLPIVTEVGSAIVVMGGEGDTRPTAHFSNFGVSRMKALLGMYRKFLEAARSESSEKDGLLQALLVGLGDPLMGDIRAALLRHGVQRKALVILLNQMGLLGLPLHAAHVEPHGAAFGDDFALMTVPSMASVRWGAASHDAILRAPRAVIAGNPTRSLDFAGLEADLVSRQLRHWARTVLQGNEATVERVSVAAKPASLVAFACHGEADLNGAWGSVVHLSDGPLIAATLSSTPSFTHKRLVTLSACETGVSDIRRSPGEAGGMPAAFMMAGVTGVVSPLWRVPDAAACLLMVEFYRRLRTGEAIQVALLGAQHWLRDSDKPTLLKWIADRRRELSILDPRTWRWRRELGLLERVVRNRSDRHPYGRPYAWAAFVALATDPSATWVLGAGPDD